MTLRAAAFLAASIAVLWSAGAAAIDKVRLPPAHEEFAAPGSGHVLTIAADDVDGTGPAEARLWATSGAARTLLWRRVLPHRGRPRHAVVADRGQVVLFDEWWKSPSPYSIMVIDRANRIVAEHGFAAVAAALGVTTARLVRTAKHGPWMASLPRLSADGSSVAVDAAEKTLAIELATGRLSTRP
jgi:hypothetical protein